MHDFLAVLFALISAYRYRGERGLFKRHRKTKVCSSMVPLWAWDAHVPNANMGMTPVFMGRINNAGNSWYWFDCDKWGSGIG